MRSNTFDKVLVTGANGLVGGAICALLAGKGVPFVAMDRNAASGVTAFDITDYAALEDFALQRGVTSVIHCAALSGPMVKADRPADVCVINIGGTVNLLELMRKNGLRRLVFCSSVSAIGPTDTASDGYIIPAPTSVYGATKAACEHILDAYRLEHSVDSVSLRFSAVYGPRRQTDCPIRTMLIDAHAGRETVFGEVGDFPTQFIHVDDAALALLAALRANDLPCRRYMATGGEFMKLSDVARIVQDTVPGARVRISPGMQSPYEAQEEFDVTPIARDLGFRPSISLRHGIVDTYLQMKASAAI
ncbi:UDP-glucose 4-epimerase [Roseovarius pacificus]|uniref:UDP-glucose 4-epimerase n=1 Tax=Roseovarius pacificus TaxID=337701 RepID=A0A1M7KK19_9RHOB|nr:NAD(P)-dependent oxidoreductase [Roseovarius pacificus]GGO62970.1 UDP-glucose 4-epimerase [Roseovarius pacificus]SHM65678.1 UDP-glucose 4-epimerase [Roseovarius pacificus]